MRAAIFDLDGVIVDTARHHFQAWQRLAGELGFQLAPEVNELVKGVSRMRSLEIVLENGAMADAYGPAERERLAEMKNRWYVEAIGTLDAREILPGALDCLNAWREAGVRIALGTASRNAPLILDRLGIRGLFHAVVDGHSVSRPKPDPEVFLCAARLLGTPASECVVLEDAVAGIVAARRAGMYAVGIGRPETLHRADQVIPDLGHFRELALALPPRP